MTLPISPSFHYHIDPDRRLLWLRVEGMLTDEALVTFYHTLYADPFWRAGYDELADYTRAHGGQVTPEAVRTLAQQSIRFEGAKRTAVVALGLLNYGMLRMYMTYAETSPEEIRLFKDRDAAREWLGIPGEAEPRSWTTVTFP